MARRNNKKRDYSDPRKNVGKYSSDSAPRRADRGTATSKEAEPTDVSNSSTTATGNEVEANAKAPQARSGNAGPNNDPEWYSKDVPMVVDAASLPYSEPLGAQNLLQSGGEVYNTDGVNAESQAVASPTPHGLPGVCTVFTKSSFGNNRYAQDPANVAANALYSHVRYVNSGRKNYDPADLFMYVSSMADIYSFAMWCQRIYAKAFVYSQRNLYVGKALLSAEHIDADNVKLNLANFRYWLNAYLNKISSWAVPAQMSYYNRRAWIYSHIYLENPDGNIKDQLYQFAPDGFYRFELDSAGAGMLKYATLATIVGHANPLTISDLQTIGDWLLTNITGDEDFGLMSGDIIKAFNGEIIGLSSVPEVVDLLPVYSEYVLLQIKNATVCAALGRDNLFQAHYDTMSNNVACYLGNVYQTPDGNIMSIEGINGKSAVSGEAYGVTIGARKVLTLKTPTPTPIDNMEISRLTLGGYGVLALTGMDPVIKISCGADIVTQVNITRYDMRNGSWDEVGTPMYANCNVLLHYQNNALDIFMHMMFEYAPMFYLYDSTGTSPKLVDNVRCISNVANYTIIDWRIIARMHEVALLSMLWVPGVAKMMNL